MQCGINMWPTVSVCGRLWVQTQTPEARLSGNQLRHNRKWSRPHKPTSFQQCECWAVPLHTDDACSTDHFYLPKEQKQKAILCLFSLLLFKKKNFWLFRPSSKLKLLKRKSRFKKEKFSSRWTSQSENIPVKSFNCLHPLINLALH